VIHHTAIIGDPPEMASYIGPGIPPYIDQDARIEAYVTVDAGCEKETWVGRSTWLMKHVHVGHDATINDGARLAPGTVIGGYAIVGRAVKIGIGALVLPCVVIGRDAVVGAGAVVTKNVVPGTVVVGNPARELSRDYYERRIVWKCGCNEAYTSPDCAHHSRPSARFNV
jgi:acyl-[acyl carrier protein]--UDP-N-acetylglucosamine O-acyltransferase